MGIARDITERKQAEDSLREALLEINTLKDQLYKENIVLQKRSAAHRCLKRSW